MQHNEEQMTPQQHAQHIAQILQNARQECKADMQRVSDPEARMLFELIDRVVGEAVTALVDYQNGRSATFRPLQPPQSGQYRTEPPDRTDMAVDVDEAEPPPRISSEIPPRP
jgi:hypothetical protein